MPEFMGPHRALKTELNAPIAMRDGVRLYADIYRPDTAEPAPVLLQRTPYNKALGASRVGTLDATRAASHGYAVVVQDTRGRYTSEGEFYPFLNEIEDGYDTVEWCGAQPWGTGKVGMYGRSYVGATQWLAAAAQPPSLAAIVPGITSSDYYEGWTYQGGALAWGFILSWTAARLALANLGAISREHSVPPETRGSLVRSVDNMSETFRWLPLKDYPELKGALAPYFYDWMAHPTSDDYWKRWRIEDHWPKITVPALNMGGWHDIFLKGTCRNYLGMSSRGGSEAARTGQRLLLGPWHHGPFAESSGEFYFGLAAADGAVDTDGLHLRWFDHWLKGESNGVEQDPPVRIFVMGANHWRDEQEWPLSRARVPGVLPPQPGQGQHFERRWSFEPRLARRRADRRVLVRPQGPGPHQGRWFVLQPVFRTGRRLRPARSGGPGRRSGVFDASPGGRPRSHRASQPFPACIHHRSRHRLHRQAGGRGPVRLRPQLNRQYRPGPVPVDDRQPNPD